jgi:hypothetical protein
VSLAYRSLLPASRLSIFFFFFLKFKDGALAGGVAGGVGGAVVLGTAGFLGYKTYARRKLTRKMLGGKLSISLYLFIYLLFTICIAVPDS